MIEAVTFDYWNTLAYEEAGHLRSRRLAAWAGILEDQGYAVERQRLDAVFDSSWQRFTARWEAGEQYLYAHAAEDILDELGFHMPDDVRRELVEVFGRAGDDAELHLTEGIGDALRRLKDAGIRIGIICDVGMTPSTALRSFLARSGLLDLFDHWSFSDEVGAYKPSPVIFHHALDGLGGVAPERAAHIGDLRRTDVTGARAMGMLSVRYTGVFDDAGYDGPEAHHVVASHAEFLRVLGVGG